MEFAGIGSTGIFLVILFISLLFRIFVGTLVLHFVTRILHFRNRSLGVAFGIVSFANILSLVIENGYLILGFKYDLFANFMGFISVSVVYWYLIKTFYYVGWKKAILVWVMSIVIAFIIATVITIILAAIIYSIMFSYSV